MTTITNTAPRTTDVIGPYSQWPRRTSRRHAYGWAALVSGLGVFLHCGLPLIG